MSNLYDWNDEERSEAELELENRLLKAQIEEMGKPISDSGHSDPHTLNRFLKNIIAFHEMDAGPQREIISLFPDAFEFPPAETLSKVQLKEKLHIIHTVLNDNRISLDLAPALSDERVYGYFITEVLHDSIPLESMENFTLHLDGCGGYCPECFQRDVCEIKQEIWPEDS